MKWILRCVLVVVVVGGWVKLAYANDKDKLDPANKKTEVAHSVVRPASPGSLWTGSGSMVDLFSDVRATQIGDLVVIRVVENVRADQAADSKSARDASASIGLEALFGLQNHVPSSVPLDPLFSGTSGNQFKGGGTNSRSGVLTATITATVIDTLPSGNLVVEATRFIQVNEEKEKLALRGVVRPMDIGPGNEVLSTAVANLEIHYGGKGVLGSNLKPSFLFRILRFIF